jgi:hypothetical protein
MAQYKILWLPCCSFFFITSYGTSGIVMAFKIFMPVGGVLHHKEVTSE